MLPSLSHFIYLIIMYVTVASGSVQTRLTKMLLQGDDMLTRPVRSVNETVHSKLGLNLLKLIQLVCVCVSQAKATQSYCTIITGRPL